jgi:hypothetical protein
MSIHKKIDLHDCPYCGGAGLLEEEQGWCWYAMCLDCGAQTAQIEFKTKDAREEAARTAAQLWNLGKIMRSGIGD